MDILKPCMTINSNWTRAEPSADSSSTMSYQTTMSSSTIITHQLRYSPKQSHCGCESFSWLSQESNAPAFRVVLPKTTPTCQQQFTCVYIQEFLSKVKSISASRVDVDSQAESVSGTLINMNGIRAPTNRQCRLSSSPCIISYSSIQCHLFQDSKTDSMPQLIMNIKVSVFVLALLRWIVVHCSFVHFHVILLSIRCWDLHRVDCPSNHWYLGLLHCHQQKIKFKSVFILKTADEKHKM